MSKLNVYQRIHAVSREITTIAKNGRNDFHKYDYATEADFVHAIRPLLEKHGLVITPSIGSDLRMQADEKGNVLTTATVTFTITNVDNPTEQVVTAVLGQGTDKGDKGAYKLMTGAKKYFIALTFMVATGDDPEKEEPQRKEVKGKKKSSLADRASADEEDDF